MKLLSLVALLLAVPAVAGAQNPLLTAGRSALMVQAGLDMTYIDQKFSDSRPLTDFEGAQPWVSATVMKSQGPRGSVLLGVGWTSAQGRVNNLGQLVAWPSTIYPGWKQTGGTLRVQVGTVFWFK